MAGEYVLQGPTPPVSFDMSIDPLVYGWNSGLEGLPRLVFTIASHFNHPLTILTYTTPLDELHAWDNQDRFLQNFTATDIITH